MAGAFDAKVDISTAEASAALTALRKEVTLTGTSLLELNKIIKENGDNYATIAAAFTGMVAAQRAAATASKETAQADIAAARAAGIRSVADSKTEENLARKALLEAQATKATEGANLAAERGFSVSQKRIQGDVDRAAAAEKAAAATQKVTKAEGEMQTSLANSRYLMYDVAATYGTISAGLLAIPAATAAVAAAYQKDFAQVLRISDQTTTQAASLQQGLKDLGNSIPMSFKDMTDIAQMGAHLQLGNDGLVAFTETVAKFSATTGVATDVSAAMFSKMKTMFDKDSKEAGPQYFNLLGSSIAEMGTKIVATDQQVTSMVTSIQAAASTAGMSTKATVGLAGAMASLSIQPEMARGALTRLFATFTRDSADATGKMQKFGDVMGISGVEAAKLWKSDPNKFFNDLIGSLNKVQTSGGNLTTVFDTLGIKNVRDIATLQRLAVGYDVLGKAQEGANDGYSKGVALNNLSKPVFETLVAKITEMANAWKNLGDTLGSGILAPIGAFMTVLKDVAIVMDTLVHQFPLLGTGIQILLGIATVTAMFMAFKGAQALVMAAMLGFKEAAIKGMGSGLQMGSMLKTLAEIMLVAKGATEQQTAALLEQVGATRALMIASTTTAASLKEGTAGSFGVLATSTGKAATGVKGVGSALMGMVGGPIGIAVSALALLAGHFISTASEAQAAGKAIAEGLAHGSEAGASAVATQLNDRKVSAFDGAAGFSDIGKSVTEMARKANISFETVVNAIAKGDEGMKKFKATMETVAKNNGFKDLNEALANPVPGTTASTLQFLNKVVEDNSTASKAAAKDLKDVAQAAPKAGDGFKEMVDPTEAATTSLKDMTKKLKDLNDEVFGTINASADLQGSLVKIGEGLQKGTSFNVNNETGRTNIKNVQDALTKARDYYEDLMTKQQMTAQQAAQGYSDFTAKLMGDIRTKFGANTSYIDAMATQTTAKFRDAIGGAPVTVPVKTNPAQVQAAATQTASIVQGTFGNLKTELTVGMNPADAEQKINQLVIDLARITGLPQMVIVDALTNPASEKAGEIKALLKSIENHTYVAPVNANTDPAIQNVRNFVSYAQTALANVQNAYNQLAATSPTLAKYLKPTFKGVSGVSAPAGIARPGSDTGSSISTPAAPAQVEATVPMPPPDPALVPSLDNVRHGYDAAADSAKKSGKAAKESAADAKEAAKDYASGISEAVEKAVDYGNRLKTALMSAYTQQYALTTATDDYHSALNAIEKKRADEIKQVTDLKDKIKLLNDERAKELITANKAKIEQGISLKYGEGARAADYGQQAQTALDNAAAKQKEIDAATKESKTIQDGIGNLTGYSEAAIANRAALRGLEVKMIDMVAAYATMGHSSEEVRRYAQALTGQYQTDVGQLGFNMAAVNGLQGSMQRYIDTINRVPQVVPTKVTADTSAAKEKFDDLNGAIDTLEQPVTIPVDANTSALEAHVAEALARVQDNLQKTLKDPVGTGSSIGGRQNGSLMGGMYTGGMVGFASGGMVPGTPPSNPRADNMMAQVDGKGLIKIRSREFIQPQEAVDYYGPDFMEAIRTMSLPKFNTGGSVSGSRGGGSAISQSVVDLSATTLAALADMRQEIRLFADAKELASSVNAGNRQLAAEGHRS